MQCSVDFVAVEADARDTELHTVHYSARNVNLPIQQAAAGRQLVNDLAVRHFVHKVEMRNV